MVVLTATRTQNRVAAAARKVGGYGALIRLSKQRLTAPQGSCQNSRAKLRSTRL
jgi:hypothetical protein